MGVIFFGGKNWTDIFIRYFHRCKKKGKYGSHHFQSFSKHKIYPIKKLWNMVPKPKKGHQSGLFWGGSRNAVKNVKFLLVTSWILGVSWKKIGSTNNFCRKEIQLPGLTIDLCIEVCGLKTKCWFFFCHENGRTTEWIGLRCWFFMVFQFVSKMVERSWFLQGKNWPYLAKNHVNTTSKSR